MKKQLNEVRKFQKIAGLIKESYDETNLDTIISDIQSHIETSSAIGDPDFKVSALNVIKSIDDSIKYENWEEVLLDLEDLQSELEQKNPAEYEEVFSEMFEKAIRRVEVLAIDNEDDDDDYGSDNPEDDYGPVTDYGKRRQSDDASYFGTNENAGLEEDSVRMWKSDNPEGDRMVLGFLKKIAKLHDYPVAQAAIFVKERLKKLGF